MPDENYKELVDKDYKAMPFRDKRVAQLKAHRDKLLSTPKTSSDQGSKFSKERSGKLKEADKNLRSLGVVPRPKGKM
jgi:hypothetical protein